MKISTLAQPLGLCVAFLTMGLCPFSSAIGEPLHQASITQAVNSVSYQANQSAPQQPASPGTVIHSDNIVRTGIQSRAELTFNDNTVTRMGANSAFSFDAQSQKINLEQGTMLFCKPKEASAFEISTPAATCAISGTTGFLEVLPGKGGHSTLLFGLIEGHTVIIIGDVGHDVVGGQMLVLTPDGQVHVVDFDVPLFVRKAGLFTHFHSTLPNQKQIDHAIKEYLALEARGFIKPLTGEGQYLYPDLEFLNTQAGQQAFAAQILQFEQQQSNPPPPQQPQYCPWNLDNNTPSIIGG